MSEHATEAAQITAKRFTQTEKPEKVPDLEHLRNRKAADTRRIRRDAAQAKP